jgi:hypothetical protein
MSTREVSGALLFALCLAAAGKYQLEAATAYVVL